MFTWVCPKCGREIPPSYSECPTCADALPAENGTWQPAPAQQAAEPGAGVSKPPGRRLPGSNLPPWLLTVLSAAIFGLLAVGAFVGYRYFSGGSETLQPRRPAASAATNGATSATPGVQVLLEYLEVTGLRLVEDKSKKSEVVFLVVNHSSAPLTDLSATVTLRPSTAKPGAGIVGIFAFEHVSLGPFESRELRAPLKTTLRPYELPDWEFLRTEISIASPMKP
jgi:hypothetical protein